MPSLLLRFSALALLWAAWSGKTTPLLIAFGIASCAAVVLLMRRGRRIATITDRYPLGARPLLFAPWLVWQVVLSNLRVARIILTPALPVSPRLVLVPAGQRTSAATALHANGITLTPGTVSLDVRDGAILVHALTEAGARDVATGAMGRRVSALEPTA